MSFRNALCTTNNPQEDAHDYLERAFKILRATYICGQLEKGENGTIHI